MWLVYTRSMSDLMLNAVALSYVLQVDELLYSVVVPSKVKALISMMEPLAMGGIPHYNKCVVPRRTILTISLSLTFGSVILVFFIVPHSESARDIATAVCRA